MPSHTLRRCQDCLDHEDGSFQNGDGSRLRNARAGRGRAVPDEGNLLKPNLSISGLCEPVRSWRESGLKVKALSLCLWRELEVSMRNFTVAEIRLCRRTASEGTHRRVAVARA